MDFSLSSSLVGNAVLGNDKLALDLQFALDKTLTARKGPTPVFTRGSTGRFVGSNGLIQSAAINAPRFDHDFITGVCKGLLMEEARTNLLSFSEAIGNAAWSGFATATAVDNQSTSPSGVVLSASRLTANSGTTTARTRVRVLAITTGGTAYSASAFIKAGSSNFGVVSLAFNKVGTGGIRNCNANIVFSTGVVTQTGVSNANFTVTSTPYPDGWYRITVSATSNASTIAEDQVVIGVGLSFNGIGGSGTFAGTETVFAWGAQLELGTFPTSYIPTTTVTLARSADVCSITGANFTSFWNRFAGTCTIGIGSSLGTQPRFISNLVAARAVELYGSTNIDFFEASGSQEVRIISNPTYPIKLGLAYAINDYQSAYNGILGGADTNTGGTIPNATELHIGNLGGTSNRLTGHIQFIRYYKKRLSNSKLASLTV